MLFFCSFIIVSCIWFVITVSFLMSVRILRGFVCWHFSVPWRTLCFLQEVFFVLFCFLFSLPCLPLSFSAASFMLKVKSESEVTLSCPTLCDPMDCSLPGSSVHGIFQARVLEWGAIAFSRGSSLPRDRTRVSHIAGRHFTIWKLCSDGKALLMILYLMFIFNLGIEVIVSCWVG